MKLRHAAALALVGWYLMYPLKVEAQTVAKTNAHWCPGVPKTPPPPGWGSAGDWAEYYQQCATDHSGWPTRKAHSQVVLCRHLCGAARGLWGSSKNSRLKPK